MFTIDASVHLNALNIREEGSGDSLAFLAHVRRNSLPVFSPTLLLVELASSLARLLDDPVRAIEFAMSVQGLAGQTWVPLSRPIAQTASRIGAEQRLRGADAVYAAVARRYTTTLVTLDQQQIERLSPILSIRRPAEALREFEKQ